jgi:hypothetical protein
MPWPRFTWDATARQYRDSRGRFVPRADVREALDATIDRAAADIEAVARRLQVGEVEIGEWHAQTEGLLKLLHVASGAAAVGGWGQATPETWGLVGSRLKDQYRFLRDFAGQLANGLPLDGRFLARAGMYALSGTATYEAILRRGDLAAGYDLEKRVLHPGKSEACSECVGYAALGWQPAGTMPDIGQGSRCLTRCRCRFVRRRSGTRLPRISPITGAIVTAFAAPEVDFDDAGLVAGPEVEFGDFEPAEPEPEPQPYRPPWWRRMVAFATKGRLPRKAHAGLNSGCGTGAGGFKHGNTCGKRVGAHGTGRGGTQAQRKKLAAKIRALRGLAKTPEQKKQLLAAIRTLKAHERGTGDAAQAAKIRRQIHAGKAPKVAVPAKQPTVPKPKVTPTPKPTPKPKQPTARERIKAAVTAKRAERGLSPEQRTKEANLRRAVRQQQAEAKAKAERTRKVKTAVGKRRKERGLLPEQRAVRASALKASRAGQFRPARTVTEARAQGAALGVHEAPGSPQPLTVEHWNAVNAEMAKLPRPMLDKIGSVGGRLEILNGRGIPDHPDFAHLRGVQPRGHPPGRTWDDTPGVGAAVPGRPTVVLANKLKPGFENGHGTLNLIIHEHAHSFDYAHLAGGGTRLSQTPEWRTLHKAADWKGIAYHSRFPEEGFARTFEEYFHSPETRARMDPRLSAYMRKLFPT